MENLRDPKDVIIGDKTLAELIAIHYEWLRSTEKSWNYSNPPVKLANVDLSGVNLESVNFSRMDMTNVDFKGSNLRNACLARSTMNKVWFNDTCLSGANMWHSSMWDTIFDNANLSSADLSFADIRFASFDNTNLYGVNFKGTIIYQSTFYHSNCEEASFVNAWISDGMFRYTSLKSVAVSYRTSWFYTSFDDESMVNNNICSLACPSHGSFVAWKFARLKDNHSNIILVKLEIPEDAQRSSGTTNKCRASKAKVLEVEDLDGNKLSDDIEIVSDFDPGFTYKVGDIIEPDIQFDNNRWNECSHGIHFFIDKRDAIVMAKEFIRL